MWNRTDTTLPPENEILRVITESGDERELLFYNGLWFLPDKSMYVYFVPVYWKRMGT